MIRDLSDVGYWTLKFWRDCAEEREPVDDYGHNRQWIADLNAEIARRSWQQPDDGYDVQYSPMWLHACNVYCSAQAHLDRALTAEEQAAFNAWDAWFKQDVAKIRACLARRAA